MSEQDYVDKSVSDDEGYDYTKDAADHAGDGDVPFGNIDDEGWSGSVLPGVSADKIEEQSFRQIEPGEHIVQVLNVEWMSSTGRPEAKLRKFYVKRPADGIVLPYQFACVNVKVTFCKPGSKNHTINDIFTLPPIETGDAIQDRENREVYSYGFAEGTNDAGKSKCAEQDRENGGAEAKKFKHFMSRLGFACDDAGQFPPESQRFGNWKYYTGTKIPRLIKIIVNKGNDAEYWDKRKMAFVKPTKIWNRIAMYGYSLVPPPPAVIEARQQSKPASPPFTPTSAPKGPKSTPKNQI